MRTLSSTLLAAQKSGTRLPYVKLEIRDRVAGITRLSWQRLYTGSEPDFHHAATMSSDGSLTRARVAPSTNQLYRQRVTSPGQGSDFSAWTAVCSVSSASGIALASRGSAALLFYADTDQQTIYCRESTDCGATFGDPTQVTTASSGVGWLAAAINPGNAVCLFYSVGSAVYAVKRTGGTWGSPSAWTNSAAAITGIGCVHQGDWNLAVCGQDSAGSNRVWTCVYGDGYSRNPGVWSSLAELMAASAGSNVEFRCPCLDYPDVFRLFFVEKYSGTESYSRPCWSHSLASADFVANLWREPVPFNLSSDYGTAMTHGGSCVWLSTPSGLWRAPISPSPLNVSNDVLWLSAQTRGLSPLSGNVQILLRNDDGRYSIPPSPIKPGSEVLFSPGYRTASGLEVSSGLAYWIDGWSYLSAMNHEPRAMLRLYASDGWGLLERWKARRQFAWAAEEKDVFQLLRFILSRAGLELSAFSSSDALVNHYPAFTVNPGESGKTAVLRLLSRVPDVLFFCGSYGYIVNPQASDSSVYSYGTAHAILEAEYAKRIRESNRVQVFGSGVFTEDWDWDEIELVYDRLAQVHDINLDTAAGAHDRGEAALRKAGIESLDGYILVPMNCGQELYDVIDITDPLASLSAAQRRVLSLHHLYDTQKGVYTLKIGLGNV
ncbi:MAG: hypothetical protein FJ004_06695 [Chloroflexi bacterium]|nr:hypothetical protein [Chloroflexota bacterium]